MEVAPFFVDFHHFLSIFTIFCRFSRITHFCRDLHFVAIYALFPQIFFGQNSLLRNITRFLHVCPRVNKNQTSRVKNDLKWLKNEQKTWQKIVFNQTLSKLGEGGGAEGGLAKDHTFSGFFFRHTPLREFLNCVFASRKMEENNLEKNGKYCWYKILCKRYVAPGISKPDSQEVRKWHRPSFGREHLETSWNFISKF